VICHHKIKSPKAGFKGQSDMSPSPPLWPSLIQQGLTKLLLTWQCISDPIVSRATP
jgi:hypothetical protein